MNHNDALLQAVLASPDDDTPRLVYADWLEERGDPRGEFSGHPLITSNSRARCYTL
jgi:uncharacterized protein (TIGR02996 family)